MIFDRIDHLRQYGNLPHGIPAAVEYLLQTDFAQVVEGRHEIDGDRLVAIVQRYQTHPVAEAQWEAHRRYVDLQILLEGQERMGHFLLSDAAVVETPYKADGDVIFFKGPGSLILMRPRDVAVFLPQDIHAPGLAVGDHGSEVRKVEVKCRID
jgi:YhcH/YjgK/YiaL family protein